MNEKDKKKKASKELNSEQLNNVSGGADDRPSRKPDTPDKRVNRNNDDKYNFTPPRPL